MREGSGLSRAARWIEDHATVCLCVLLVLFAGHAYLASGDKPLWFDELFSLVQAQADSWRRLRAGMQADGNPPLYSLLAHVCVRLFGLHAFTLRMPSLAAYEGAAVLLFVYVRRWWGGLTALVAVLVLLTHPFAVYYATEARPYGLVLFFVMLTLLGWTLAIDSERKPAALVMVALGIAGAILSHHLAILSVGLPIFVGELTRLIQRRRLDWPLLGAAAAGALAWSFTLPMIADTKGGLVARTGLQTSSVTPALLYADYRRMLDPLLYPFAVLGLVLLVSYLLRRDGSQDGGHPWTLTPVRASVFTTGFTLLAAWLLIRFTTHYWVAARYGIGTVVGVCLLCAYLGWLSGRGAQIVLLCLLLPAALPTHRHAAHAKPLELNCLNELPGSDRIVIAKALQYPQQWWYADEALRPRLAYLEDADYPGYRRGMNIADLSLIEQRKLAPWKLDEFEAFTRSTQHFLLVNDNSPEEGLLSQHLKEDGWTLTNVVVPECLRQGLQVRTAEKK